MRQAHRKTVLAATAEEMRGQAQSQQLIGFFKIDGGDGHRPAARTFRPSPPCPAAASVRNAPSLCGPKAPDGFTRLRGDAKDLAEERPC